MVARIEMVAAVAPRLVVVLLNGSPVEMPWVRAVPAVLTLTPTPTLTLTVTLVRKP